MKTDKEKRFVSVDGDADRLIYFYVDAQEKFHMLDGDKIATLIATWIVEELARVPGLQAKTRLGIVQTAYANGSSTHYMKESLGVTPVFAKTGVKHLHHKAQEYDIGVYFEANGHGTVIFKKQFEQTLRDLADEYITQSDSPARSAALRLANLPKLINQATGDALSDILVTESILLHKNWTLVDMDQMYTDLPNRLKAVKVADKNAFVTTDLETELIKPEGLQEQINQLVQSYSKARSFIRPSGTENVVRVYAEAATKDQVEELAQKVENLLKPYQ